MTSWADMIPRISSGVQRPRYMFIHRIRFMESAEDELMLASFLWLADKNNLHIIGIHL